MQSITYHETRINIRHSAKFFVPFFQETVFGLTASDRVFLSTAHLLQLKVLKSDGLLHLIEEEGAFFVPGGQENLSIFSYQSQLDVTDVEKLNQNPRRKKEVIFET